MKTRIAIAVLLLGIVAAVALGVREATKDPAPCQKPVTLLSTEQTASIKALEEYISENIAPTFKDSKDVTWESIDYNPTLLPGKVSAAIAVENPRTGVARYYHITLVRDCQGDDWRVVEFKKSK